jgi:O-antigen ligase
VSADTARLALDRVPAQLPAAAALVAACGVAGALAVRTESMPSQLVVALPLAAVAAALVFAAASIRPAAAIALAFVLLAVVTTDPAPVDLVFALVIAGSIGIVPPPAVPGFVAVPVVLYVAVTLASAMNANDTGRALQFAAITVYLVILAVWLTGVFRVERLARVAIQAYLVAATLSAGLAALALYVGFPGSDQFLYDNLRAEGLFQDPNVFGAFLVPAAAILLDAVGRVGLRSRRGRVSAAAFVVVSVGVVIAYSRAAWLAYALAMATVVVVQALRRGGPRAAARSASLLACGAAGALLILSVTGSLQFFHQRSALQGYDSERFQTQESAFELMTTHVLGFGPGQTEVELRYSTHSLYARTAYEQGLFGLALVAVILLVTLWCALVAATRARVVFGVGTAALLGSWIGLIVNSAFIDTLHWRHLWVVAALIWAAYVATEGRRAVTGFASTRSARAATASDAAGPAGPEAPRRPRSRSAPRS